MGAISHTIVVADFDRFRRNHEKTRDYIDSCSVVDKRFASSEVAFRVIAGVLQILV